MLFLPGVDCKSYWDLLGRGQSLPPIGCPCCGTLLCGHGWYQRYLNEERVELRRVRCPPCRVTHAVVPEDVCAYRDLTLVVLEKALAEDGGPTAKARACGEQGGVAVRRVRAWDRRWFGGWLAPLQWLLPGSAGSVWERIRAAFGETAGVLIRLRRWLWSRGHYFFSGLTGLYRHGRPRSVVLGLSTEVGNCPTG